MWKSNKILVVDDEIEICQMLSRHFRFLGYDVAYVHDGVEALEYLNTNKIDVVISDIMMPKMDGVTLLKKIRDEYPMIHVIIITGYISLDNALCCMRRKADTFIFKPLNDLSELETAVATAIENIDNWKNKFLQLRGMKRDYQEGSDGII